jgi:hypothetical protein
MIILIIFEDCNNYVVNFSNIITRKILLGWGLVPSMGHGIFDSSSRHAVLKQRQLMAEIDYLIQAVKEKVIGNGVTFCESV